MPDLVGERFTRSLGLGPGLAGAEALAALRALRARHEAVCRLISALEFAAGAGCDLGFFRCLGCERIPPGGPGRKLRRRPSG